MPTFAWVLLLTAAGVAAGAQGAAAPGNPDAAAERGDARAAAAPTPGAAAKKNDDNDADSDQKKGAAGKLALSAAQQEAVGIQIGTPQQLTSAPETQAYGVVLDPVSLLTDADRMDSTRAVASAASADAARVENLYRDGAQASLKTLQAAQAQSVEANAQAQAAVMLFRQLWGPLADLTSAQRHSLLETLGRGQRLLMRADVPGRHVGAGFGPRALVDVDGLQVSAHVLGALPRTDAQSQSAGWLLQVDTPPAGLGAGARAPVRLQSAALSGLLVPAAALIYAHEGAYVYRQVGGETPGAFRYDAIAVKPLARVGDAWLVDGLTRQDRVVVQGAGVLWSLQGLGTFSAAEEDHD